MVYYYGANSKVTSLYSHMLQFPSRTIHTKGKQLLRTKRCQEVSEYRYFDFEHYSEQPSLNEQ